MKKKGYKCKQLPSGKWNTQVRYTTEAGESKVKSITANSQAECLKAAQDFRDGSKAANDTEHLTIEQAIKGYLEDHDSTFKDGTKQVYKTLCDRLKPFAKVKVNKVDRRQLQKIVDHLTKASLQESTIWLCLRGLRAVINYYTNDSLTIKRNDLQFRQEPVKRKELPDIEEVLDIIKGTDIETACMLSLFVGGMRINEVCGLQYGDIFYDEDDGLYKAHIHRSRVLVAGKEIVQDTPKTVFSDRNVVVPKWLFDRINGQVHFRENEFVVPLKYHTLDDKFRRIVKPLKEQGYTITFHSLRKIYAVTNHKAGVPLNDLARNGGWSEGSTVLTKIYLQSSQKSADKATDMVENYLASRCDSAEKKGKKAVQ